jgi:hypothetical protein
MAGMHWQDTARDVTFTWTCGRRRSGGRNLGELALLPDVLTGQPEPSSGWGGVMTNAEKESPDKPPATKWSRFLDLGPGWISAIGTVAAAVIAGIGLLISNSVSDGPKQPTPSTQSGTILSPANVPPKVGLCTKQVIIGADGNVGPISCSNGDLNSLAWQDLAKENLNVMALGSDALPDQVLRAMCSDVQSGGSTQVIEVSAYNISALYYGWKFGVSPSQEFLDGDC